MIKAPRRALFAACRALGAIGEMFQDAVADRDIPRRRVISWAMWDWAMQPFNTVILTFVWIALYLTSRQFLDPAVRDSGLLPDGSYLNCNASENVATAYCQGLTDLSGWWGWATSAAGILILVLAPVLGQQADARGSKKKWVSLSHRYAALRFPWVKNNWYLLRVFGH